MGGAVGWVGRVVVWARWWWSGRANGPRAGRGKWPGQWAAGRETHWPGQTAAGREREVAGTAGNRQGVPGRGHTAGGVVGCQPLQLLEVQLRSSNTAC